MQQGVELPDPYGRSEQMQQPLFSLCLLCGRVQFLAPVFFLFGSIYKDGVNSPVLQAVQNPARDGCTRGQQKLLMGIQHGLRQKQPVGK